MTGADQGRFELDTDKPNPARVYDYLLGGKDNFPADRAVGDAVIADMPQVRRIALSNRAFLRRAVQYLAGEAGIRQFLDIGTGIPTQGNTHQVAQAVAPSSRVAYVDNDPIVLTHSRALLADDNTTIIQADLREPGGFLEDSSVRKVIDFERPVAIMLVAVLHFIRPEDGPDEIMATLRDAIVPGSYLVVSHVASDLFTGESAEAIAAYQRAIPQATWRDHAEISAFFEGFDLVEPGLVQLPLWRPEDDGPINMDFQWLYAGVGRKR